MDNEQTLVERLLATKRVVTAFCSMDRTTEYEDRLVNPDGPEAAATITALEAEINLKADFIEATINQLAQADDDKAALQARVVELEALGRIEAQAVCIAAATLTGGDHG